MKIGVISDTHGSLTAWKAATSGPLQDVEVILHAGDVLYHGPRNPLPEGYRPGELARELNDLQVPLLVARGNCDSEVDQAVFDWPLQTPYVFAQFGKLRVLVEHGHNFTGPEREELAKKFGINLWVSGHTHVPRLERAGECLFLNPGSPALPKQEDKTPTVAVIDGEEVSVYSVASGERLLGLQLP